MNGLNEFTTAEFWETLNPDLSITTTPFADRSKDFEFDDAEIDESSLQIKEEGYFKTGPVIGKSEVEPVAGAIEKIVACGLPPVFVFVYDEVWQVFGRLSNILGATLGQNHKILLAGMWAWRIEKNGAGFKPHRDMGTINKQVDGRPSNLSVWIPFTNATPLNSCMYVLPTNLDPNHPDNLSSNVIPDAANIRALPAAAGSILAWDASILHWGSRSSRWAEQPRISIAMDYCVNDSRAETDYSECYSNGPDLFIREAMEFPFQSRLHAIGEAIWTYRNRVITLFPDQADMLFEFCNSYSISPGRQTEVSREVPDLIRKRDLMALLNKQKHEEALPLVQDICKTHPDDIDAHRILCKVLFSLDMKNEAVEAVRRALAVFPAHKAMRDLLFMVEKNM